MGYVKSASRPWLSRLNGRQRAVSFFGLVLLLLVVLCPEYETSHYIWLSPGWYRLGGTIKRAFVTDIRHGEIVKVLPAGDPELRHLVDFRDANDATFERRTAIRLPTVILQGLLTITLTLLAIWLTDGARWRSSGAGRVGHFDAASMGQGPDLRWRTDPGGGAAQGSQLVKKRIIPDSRALIDRPGATRAFSAEVLPLVLDNAGLDTEIKGQLGPIASEQAKSGPRPAPSTDAQRPADAAGDSKRGSALRPERANPSLFHNPGTRNRLPLIVAVGIALLIAIPFLIQVVTAPERHAPAPDLTVGKTGPTAELQTLRNSQRFPELVPNPAPEVAPGPPAEMSHKPVSLRNGTNLIPPQGSKGLGKLKISNYTGSDAAVKLKTLAGKTTVRFVYVRAMSDVTVAKIVPGEYVVQFATGRDWDPNDLAFRQDRAFAIFDKALSFSEKHGDDGTVYSTHEITLHAVPNGNVRKKPISAEEFSGDGNAGGNRRH